MVSDESGYSLDSVLQFMSEYVREQGARVQGTNLAVAIRKRFPGFAYAQVGHENLVGLIREAEERGLLIRHKDVVHVEVSCSLDTPRATRSASTTGVNRIQPDIWRAFVIANPPQGQFLDRSTGLVVTDPQEMASSQGEVARYVPIKPIPSKTQKAWMHEFVKNGNLEDCEGDLVAAIESDAWWETFSGWLKQHCPDHESPWRSFRTRQVIGYVREWARENDVPFSLLLMSNEGRSKTVVGLHAACSDNVLREAILAVIKDLPLDKLEDISIPFRYIRRHFQPRR